MINLINISITMDELRHNSLIKSLSINSWLNFYLDFHLFRIALKYIVKLTHCDAD